MMRSLTLLLAGLGVLSVGSQLSAAPASALINQPWAARHGLTRAWYANVQMDRSRGQITHLVLDEGILFVQTNQAMVHAMDAETGQTIWAMQIGKPGDPDMPVDARGDYVAVINGSVLYILNRYDGKLLWQKKLIGCPGAGPGLSDRQVYVPMIDGDVYTYPLKPADKPILKIEGLDEKKGADAAAKGAAKPAPADNPSAAPAAEAGHVAAGSSKGAKAAEPLNPKEEQARRQSLRLSQEFLPALVCPSVGQAFTRPLVTTQSTGEESIAWTTSRGFLYMGKLFENRFAVKYRLTTGGPIATEPTYLPSDVNIVGNSGVIFGTSEDGFVYAIRETDGELVWRFSTGEPITERSGVIGLRVYVPTQSEGMYCLNAETGEQLWWAPNIKRFIAASKDRVYTMDRIGWMVVLNAATGARLDTFDISGTPIRMTNDTNDRLYLATTSGLVQCLHEIDVPQPIQHQEILRQERAKQAEQRAAEKEAAKGKEGAAQPPAEGQAPAAGQPAGQAPAADPFGGANPPAAANEDPFNQ
jgi:outer membrane protein assembly factor BamB